MIPVVAFSIGTFSLFSVLLLIGCLTTKELLDASDNERCKSFSRCLDITIAPLLMSFVVIVALKVVEILG